LEEWVSAVWNSAELDLVNNFCTYIDAHMRSELYSTDDREKFPGVVAEFYKRIEDKKKFNEIDTMEWSGILSRCRQSYSTSNSPSS
jgi:hypothetical protein